MQSSALGGDLQVLVAQPADQVEGFARRLLLGQARRIGLDVLLDDRAHRRRRPEESVGRDQPVQRLVRPLEVVVLHPKRKPPLQVVEVGKHRTRQVLVPQRLPEALHLAQRLRVLWAALDVADALLAQELLERGLAPPGRVLPAVVGQKLPRHPVLGNPPLQRLQHQLRFLVVRQCVGDQVTRVVVHERGHVHPLVTAQQKREDV